MSVDAPLPLLFRKRERKRRMRDIDDRQPHAGGFLGITERWERFGGHATSVAK
jgi:hypothetical protein